MQGSLTELLIPPTEREVADLINAVQVEPTMHMVLRKLIFQRDKLANTAAERERVIERLERLYREERDRNRWQATRYVQERSTMQVKVEAYDHETNERITGCSQ